MTQDSMADYSTLQDAVLAMWLPAAGVQTAAEWWGKNLEKIYSLMSELIHALPCVTPDDFLRSYRESFIFKTNFNSYFDAQPPFQLREAILTGSLSEGLFLYILDLPDMDFMCVLKNITFSQEGQGDGNLLLREDTPFVYAFVTNKEAQHLWSEFLEDADKQEGKQRLSSRKLKEKLHENYQKTGKMFRTLDKEEIEEIKEGAAVTIRKQKPSLSLWECFTEMFKKFLTLPVHELRTLVKDHAQCRNDMLYKLFPSSDIVLSIFCEGWPSCAREWITRERLWPDIPSVEKIAKGGFHIVPKSSHDGDFRLSFSCAETMLIKTLIPLQHKVIRAFKAVVKYHQNTWSSNLKEILSSYHLKTIAFWHFEKISQEAWTEESVVHHLVTLLEELAEALRIQNLPMYFMPKVNLIQNIDDPEVSVNLVEKIFQLSRNYSAMAKAVNNTLEELLLPTDSECDTLSNLFDTIGEGKLKKAEEQDESICTFYDIFLALDKLINKLN